MSLIRYAYNILIYVVIVKDIKCQAQQKGLGIKLTVRHKSSTEAKKYRIVLPLYLLAPINYLCDYLCLFAHLFVRKYYWVVLFLIGVL